MYETSRLTPPVSERDHAEGPDSAKVTLVEYGDYQCSYCGAAYSVVKRLQREFGENLRFVFRNFPLTQVHPYARIAAELAEGAGLQKRFWPMHDLIYENQDQLAPEILQVWADQVGMDWEKFRAATTQGEIAKRLKEDRASGIHSGVNGTPSFFINGTRYDGPPDYASMRAALDGQIIRS
jgi:protein-disulfide isomerase